MKTAETSFEHATEQPVRSFDVLNPPTRHYDDATTAEPLQDETDSSFADTSLDQPSPIATPAPAAPSRISDFFQPPPVHVSPEPHEPEVPTVFKFNKAAFWITAAGLATVAVITLIGLVFINHEQKANQSNQSKPSDYGVSSLQLDLQPDGNQLKVDELSVNGKLIANNTLVLSPTSVPVNPTAGQIYYYQTTNTPY